MPKPKGLIWKFYDPALVGGKDGFVCKYCGTFYRRNATRQEKHLQLQCLKVPMTVKRLFLKPSKKNNEEDRDETDEENSGLSNYNIF